jgi:hypothetical protein
LTELVNRSATSPGTKNPALRPCVLRSRRIRGRAALGAYSPMESTTGLSLSILFRRSIFRHEVSTS